MAGLLSRVNLEIAAMAAVELHEALAGIADDYGEPTPRFSVEALDLAEMLDAGDVDGIAEALPQVMAQLAQQMQQEQQSG